jgi:hypothetical protein
MFSAKYISYKFIDNYLHFLYTQLAIQAYTVIEK